MAKIQSFPKARLKNAEWLTACTSIELKLTSESAISTKSKLQFDLFKASLKEYSNSLIKLTKSEYTEQARTLKKRSNASRTGFFDMIRGYLTSSDLEKKKAAISLMSVVHRFVNMSTLSFENLIGQTEKLIIVFESDDMKKYITTLTIGDRVTALKAINAECTDVFNKKMEETGRRNRPRKTPITRHELNKAYEDLVVILNARAQIDGDSDYLDLFTWWNAMIDNYRILLSQRHGAGAGGKTDSGLSNMHDPNSGTGGEERPEIN